MKGHVRHLGGDRWRLYVDGPRDPLRPRKRNQISRVVRAADEEHAEIELARLVIALADGKTVERAPTFAELVERWLPLHDCSPGTRHEYSGVFARYLLGPLGARPVPAIRSRDLDEIYVAMLSRGLDPATVRKAHTVVRAALRQAQRWEIVERSPADLANAPTVPKPRPKAPADVIVKRLLDGADDEMAAWLTLGSITGARRGERAALRRGDLDDNDCLTIDKALAYVPGRGLYEKRTKEDDVRVLALDPYTVTVLRRHLARQAQLNLAVGVAVTPDSYMFHHVGEPERPVHLEDHTRRFARLRKKLGIAANDVKDRQLRHYVGTELVRAGYDPVEVAAHLGNTATTVLRFYAAARPGRGRALADVMRSRLGSEG